ncbi:MAG: GNAT family N-acetyltransferase, partial [Cellulosilyticaceae bacterium]
MELVRATMKDMGAIERLVKQVILEIYPKYYPEEVVKAFLDLHRAVNIGGDIVQERVWLLYDEGVLVGTGTCEHEHITRVYVLPGCQGKGYGTYIMDVLEKMMREKYKVVSLDTSAPALAFYKHRGYEVTRVCEWQVAEGVSMSYEIMEKRFEEEKEQMKLKLLSEQFSVCKIADV